MAFFATVDESVKKPEAVILEAPAHLPRPRKIRRASSVGVQDALLFQWQERLGFVPGEGWALPPGGPNPKMLQRWEGPGGVAARHPGC